jgi:hypothetical protein
MRLRSGIFSLTFVMIFGFLHIYPLIPNAEVRSEQTSNRPVKKKTCSKSENKPPCSKSKCPKQKSSEKKEEGCTTTPGCNPFTPCATSSCCYIIENFFSYTGNFLSKKQKHTPVNDNRLLNKISECWHPPEVIS